MKINKFAVMSSLIAVLGLSAAAQSAVLPMKIESFTLASGLTASAAATPSLSVKSVPLQLLPSTPMLPSFPGPVSGPRSLPGRAFPLPLSLPSALSTAHEFPGDDIHLDWSFLDGDEGSAALVTNGRGPKPLIPKGAAAQLTFAAEAAEKNSPIRAGADELFDRARQRVLVSVP
jgi:hypothetical protein